MLAQTSTSSGYTSLLFLLVMVAVFYFFILRPQRNRMRSQQQLQSTLQLGDRVHTVGGVIGVVRELDSESVVLEVEQGRIRFARRAIAGRASDER